MNHPDIAAMEQRVKEQAYKEEHEAKIASAPGGMAASASAACQQTNASPSKSRLVESRLVDELRARVSHKNQLWQEANQLEELVYLLDKNPDVARILELVRRTGAI